MFLTSIPNLANCIWDGALIVVDPAAVFTSTGHEFLFRVLIRASGRSCRVLDMPSTHVNYKDSVQIVKLDVETSRSFEVKSGVRHGCPVSPVLLAFTMEPF